MLQMAEMLEMSNIIEISEDDEFSDFDDDYNDYYQEFDTYSQYEITPFTRWYYGKIAEDTANVQEPIVYEGFNDFRYEVINDDESDNSDSDAMF